jgi:hypothetical protein
MLICTDTISERINVNGETLLKLLTISISRIPDIFCTSTHIESELANANNRDADGKNLDSSSYNHDSVVALSQMCMPLSSTINTQQPLNFYESSQIDQKNFLDSAFDVWLLSKLLRILASAEFDQHHQYVVETFLRCLELIRDRSDFTRCFKISADVVETGIGMLL